MTEAEVKGVCQFLIDKKKAGQFRTFWDGFILNHGFENERVKLTGILAWNSLDIRWAAWPRGTHARGSRRPS